MTAARAEIGIYGPGAAATGRGCCSRRSTSASLPLFEHARLRSAGADAVVVRSDETGVPGYDSSSTRPMRRRVTAALPRRLAPIDVDAEAAEACGSKRPAALRRRHGRRRRFRSKRASRIARSRARRAATSGRKSSCASWIAGTAASRGGWWGSTWHPTRRRRQRASPSGDREIGRDNQRGAFAVLGQSDRARLRSPRPTSPGTIVTVAGAAAAVSSLPFAA